MEKIKHAIELLFFNLIKLKVSLFPRSCCLFLGKTLGFLIYCLDRKRRSIALSNLKTAFGENPPNFDLKKCAKASFTHLGRTFLDVLKTSSLSQNKTQRLVTIQGKEYLQKVLRKEKGALLFSAHFGNWEIALAFLSNMGKLNVIARPLDNKLLEKELFKIRTGLGAKVIYKNQAARQTLRALRANEMVAILIDQNVVRGQAVFVDFFGKKAATTPSLATFFLKTQAPLVPVFCYPSSDQRYCLEIGAPLRIHLSGEEDKDVLKITQLCTKIIQDQIRKNPNCWFWFHNRWKTRPERDKNLSDHMPMKS